MTSSNLMNNNFNVLNSIVNIFNANKLNEKNNQLEIIKSQVTYNPSDEFYYEYKDFIEERIDDLSHLKFEMDNGKLVEQVSESGVGDFERKIPISDYLEENLLVNEEVLKDELEFVNNKINKLNEEKSKIDFNNALYDHSYTAMKFIERTNDISYLFDKLTGYGTSNYVNSETSNYIKMGAMGVASLGMAYASSNFSSLTAKSLNMIPDSSSNILGIGLKEAASIVLSAALGVGSPLISAYVGIKIVSTLSSYFLTEDNIITKITNSVAYVSETAFTIYTGNNVVRALEAVKIIADVSRLAEYDIKADLFDESFNQNIIDSSLSSISL